MSQIKWEVKQKKIGIIKMNETNSGEEYIELNENFQ